MPVGCTGKNLRLPSAYRAQVGQEADRPEDEEGDEHHAEQAPLLLAFGCARRFEPGERQRRDRGELLLGEHTARVITLHAAVADCGFHELVVLLAMLEESAVGGVVVPVIEGVLPERLESALGHHSLTSPAELPEPE